MATRTEPIRLLLNSLAVAILARPGGRTPPLAGPEVEFTRPRWGRSSAALVPRHVLIAFERPCLLFLLGPLAPDQLVEPADLALDRLQPVVLQLQGVGVDPFPGPAEGGADGLQPFLEPAAPAFEDPEP